MNDKDTRGLLYHQTPLRILSFFSIQQGKTLSAQEISSQTQFSKGATNQALRMLSELDMLSRERKGNVFLYKLNPNSPVLRQFKIFETLLNLQRLVNEIMQYCYQIILFGSCADGSNSVESDIDLFIKSEHKRKVRKIIDNYSSNDLKIKAVIQEPLEIASSKKEDKAFFEQVRKGIILWEGKPAYETV